MRKLQKSFKTEINPTDEQKLKIRRTIGTCRYVYNFYLDQNRKRYEKGEKFMSGKCLDQRGQFQIGKTFS